SPAQAAAPSFAADRELLGTALGELEAMGNALFNQAAKALEDPQAVQVVGQSLTRFLLAAGDLVLGWLLQRQAAIALDKSGEAAQKDVAFYTGKVAAAHWFTRNVVPL